MRSASGAPRRPRSAPGYVVRRHVGAAMLPAAIVTGLAALLGFLSSDYFLLREVVVRAADAGLVEEVAGTIQLPKRANTIFLRLRDLSDQAQKCPRVLRATADRVLPGRVILTIVGREPVFALENGKSYILVDNEGVLLLHTARPGPDCPVVRGAIEGVPQVGARLNPDCLRTVLACIEGAQRAGMPTAFSLRLETRYDFELETPSGVLVKLGGPDNLVRKVIAAASIERHLQERSKCAQYIDVRLPGRPPSYKLAPGTT